jgi:RNA polymerase sigma factor (sigma-70 family)
VESRQSRDDEDCAPARAADAEDRQRLADLVLCRTTLTASEAALFREVFPEIFAAHYDAVWSALRKRGAREPALDDLVQDVFFAFFSQVLEEGFPDSVPAKLRSLAAGRALNQARGANRDPVSLGVPSSSSEKPRSGPEVERTLDLHELARRLLPALLPEHRDVVHAVLLRELSHEEAAAELNLSRTTVTSRLMVAKRQLFAMADLFLPQSQRGPS